MTYDSLLMNNGGGVISTTQKSEQFGGAALCIGIGGTGVAALAQLKRKVFQQLEPDDPDSPTPEYQHIQFLAIDSDDTAVDNLKGTARLTKDEYFSISMPNLAAVLTNKTTILNNPVMSWMEADKIDKLLGPMGAGGVRQVGRFLLMSKATALKNAIYQKCQTALKGTKPAMDVYVFAGISGGTGSGCFIDTCYIVRQALEEQGLDGKGNIMGFFYLPDVVTSKTEVSANASSVEYNNSNGYAAMKELDYLMNLKDEQDFFRQNYGSFSINTQKAPVDMCHLLSAQKADGSLIPNGFSYCINVAADYVMAYLAKVALPEGKEDTQGLTMQGHLSNVTRGVQGLKLSYGANLTYHILGASNAEIPMSQIATYLASGFYRRFEEQVGRQKVSIPPADVAQWATKWGLKAEDIEGRMMAGCTMLTLPDTDIQQLKTLCPVPKDKCPDPWWTIGMQWMDQCSGKFTKNREALNGELVSNLAAKNSDGSLLGKVFRELSSLAQDPSYGPYYAARLMHSETDDLRSWALGVRAQAMEEASTLSLRLDTLGDAKVQASVDLANSNFLNHQKRYEAYKQLENEWFVVRSRQNMLLETARVAEKFAEDLLELDKKFFAPLLIVLDNLNDTFKADLEWLSSKAAKSQEAYTWRILELDDVKDHLDKVIEALTPKQLVSDFVMEVLAAPDEWLQNDDGKVGMFISKYMENVFREDINKGLQDYLFLKYPQAGDNVQKLSQIIEQQIVAKVYGDATPMFWCDPNYAVTDPTVTFQSCSLSVPANAAAVCTAAKSYAKKSVSGCVARETGLKDRIFALRFVSGVPLYAYQGVTLLKKYYDEAATKSSGAGSHLYAKTDRVTADNPNIDWRTYLPTPLPQSFKPEFFPKETTEAQLELYEQGKACGAIFLEEANANHSDTIYRLRLSKPIEIPEYMLEDFLVDGTTLNRKKLSEQRSLLNHWLEHRYDKEEGAQYIELKNDGNTALNDKNVLERVRRDYFLHYPLLQAKVADEINTYQAVKAALKKLDDLEAEHNRYEDDLSAFCEGLFSGVYQVLNANKQSVFDPDESKRIVWIQYDYKDSREMDQTEVFSDAKQPKEYPFAEKYPLYQAFESYRALNMEAMPRSEMDGKVEAFRQRSKGEADILIARELERTYDSKELTQLFRSAETLEEEDGKNVTRFYNGLVHQIQDYRDNFTPKAWQNAGSGTVAQTSTQNQAPQPPQQQVVGYLYYNNQQLKLVSPFWNYGQTDAGQWVQLPPSTHLFIAKNGQWVDTVTDAQGNVHP